MQRASRRPFTIASLGIFLFAGLLASAAGAADKVEGVLGSPSATVTIDGKQIPPPPIKFGGVIKEAATASTPWWPPRVVPPKVLETP